MPIILLMLAILILLLLASVLHLSRAFDPLVWHRRCTNASASYACVHHLSTPLPNRPANGCPLPPCGSHLPCYLIRLLVCLLQTQMPPPHSTEISISPNPTSVFPSFTYTPTHLLAHSLTPLLLHLLRSSLNVPIFMCLPPACCSLLPPRKITSCSRIADSSPHSRPADIIRHDIF